MPSAIAMHRIVEQSQHDATKRGAHAYYGRSTMAKFHSNAEFLADIMAARKEVKAAKAKGISACFLVALSDNGISRCNRLLFSCQASRHRQY
ncbi:MAG: hypothetical protein V4602_17045 [Pseudomonadota bacterium]